MIKRFCDFCGAELDKPKMMFSIDERGWHHLNARISLELCEFCGIEFLTKVSPNWRAEKEECERKNAERKAEREKKKAEMERSNKPRVEPQNKPAFFYEDEDDYS